MPDRPRRGAQALEFALILPVFITLISATVDFGWYFYQSATESAVVRDATRRGTLTNAATAQDVACAGLRNAGLAVGAGPTCAEVVVTTSGVAPDAIMTVSADVPFTPLVGLMPHPARLRTFLAMHVEN